MKFLAYTNDFFLREELHYITLVFTAEYKSGEVKLMEPEAHEEWKWFDVDDLPEPLAQPAENSIQKFLQTIKKR